MKNKKYYWKVVCINDKSQYTSAIIRKGCYKAIYKVGEFISAPIPANGLMVLATRQQARKFKRSVFSGAKPTIFKAEVKGDEITEPTYYYLDFLEEGHIEVPHYQCRFPEGTHCFPQVKLIKKSR